MTWYQTCLEFSLETLNSMNIKVKREKQNEHIHKFTYKTWLARDIWWRFFQKKKTFSYYSYIHFRSFDKQRFNILLFHIFCCWAFMCMYVRVCGVFFYLFVSWHTYAPICMWEAAHMKDSGSVFFVDCLKFSWFWHGYWMWPNPSIKFIVVYNLCYSFESSFIAAAIFFLNKEF